MNGECGYIDSIGKHLIEPKFDYAKTFPEAMAIVQTGGYDLLGYRLKTPKSVFKNKADEIYSLTRALRHKMVFRKD